MPLFGKKSISLRCAEQLESLAHDQAIVEFEQTDAEGRVKASGKTRFRQFQPQDGSLLIEIPTKMGRPLPVGPGDTAHLFVVLDTAIYMFDTVILDRATSQTSSGQSVPLLKIEAPEVLQSGNRRRHVRVVPVSSAPANLTWRIASLDKSIANSRNWNKAKIQDISSRGVGICISPNLPRGLKPEDCLN